MKNQTPKIMGVLNVTPDSFYDGGRHVGDAARKQFNQLVSEGADMVDIGAESSRPGSERISFEEEFYRLKPLFDLESRFPSAAGVDISIDTMKGSIARLALERGAAIINDISALRIDPEGMLAALKDFPSSKLVLMHMKGEPKTMQMNPVYDDVIAEIISFFDERLEFLESKGISRDRVILDPGIGFGKRLEDNLVILNGINEFKNEFSLPVLMGVSRKSMIGTLLGNAPPDERLEGTISAHLYAAAQGADILRVHDVASTKKALTVWSAVQNFNRQSLIANREKATA